MGNKLSKPRVADTTEEGGAPTAVAAGGAGAESTAEDTFPLLSLPPEIQVLIPKSLDTEKESLRMMARLARSNRYLNGFFQPMLNEHRTQELLRHVLSGQEAQAKAMIAANPNLLLARTRATATTAEGRTYENVTPYEAALYVGDTQMCEMMHEYFDGVANGEEERIQQYKNVFPEGVDAVVKAQTAYDFDNIVNAVSAATNDEVTAQLNKEQNDLALCQAFNTFREEFTELSKAEKHANLKHLLKAFTLFANDTRVKNWRYDKPDLFWRQIIGFVQRYLPACDKQVFYQGLFAVVKNNERLARLEKFKYDRRDSLHVTSKSAGVGYDFGFGPIAGVCRHGVLMGAADLSDIHNLFGEFMSKKNVKLAELMPGTAAPRVSVCDSMK